MFLTAEGLDGAGGTTLVEAINEEYPDAVTTAEPSELWTGQQVRTCLTDEDSDPLTDFYFFMGDRVNHIEETIRPADEAGKLVVSDRYADSTRAYQPVSLTNSRHFDRQVEAKLFIENTMRKWEYKPDVTIYIDVSVETALDRSNQSEKYENGSFLHDVQENYRSLVANESDRFIVVNGEQPKNAVANEALSKLSMKMDEL